MNDTLISHLRHWAAVTGDSPAFTFVDFTAEPAGKRHTLTWRELETRVDETAQRLAGLEVRPGDRVAVLCPQSLDYVIGFLAAIAAGAIAVPLFDPGLPGHADRLTAVLADCSPTAALTTSARESSVSQFLSTHPEIGVLAVDREGWPGEPSRSTGLPSDTAYLQYTSGSTRVPAGVVLSHSNVLANVAQAAEGLGLDPDRATTVSWLPLFHDMGLILGLITPLALGLRSVLMDPLSFVERPRRWLDLLAEHPGCWSAAPNFAFHYCAARIRDRSGLRLGEVAGIINGAEPIIPAVLDRFHTAFAEAGYRPDQTRPSYGLAEATVFVTTGPAVPPRVTTFDREALGAGTVRLAGEGTELVACGVPAGQQVALVDPDTGAVLPDTAVGEIWIHGPNVGAGYWRKPDASLETFGARPAGSSDGPWLRTGDLGFRHEGELYIAGRIKDLIIVDGRNHYPQDIEGTVAAADPAIRPGSVAAFAVPGVDTEAAVVVAAHRRHGELSEVEVRELVIAVRRLVADRHGLALREVLLTGAGQVPRTSSGKIARGACRERYLNGEYGKALAR